MREFLKKLKDCGLAVAVLMLLCSLLGVGDVIGASGDAGVVVAAVAAVVPANGGVIEPGGEDESITKADVDSADLVLHEIDKVVTKIRPTRNPLGAIARHTSITRNTKQKVVDYYAIDVLPETTTLTTAVTEGVTQASLVTQNPGIFSVNETVFCLGVKGYKEDQVTVDPDSLLMLYIVDRDSNGNPSCVPINGKQTTGVNDTFPALAVNTVLLRGGRAASETQIRTDSYSGYPTKKMQNLQKFVAEIDVSTAYDEAKKEVRWEVSDVNEQAIFEMLTEQNSTLWMGKRRMRVLKNKYNDRPEETYFTEGVWWQMGKEFDCAGAPLDVDLIVSLMKKSFTGNAASNKKLFICGSDVIEAFERIDYTNRVVKEGAKSQAFGLEFTSIVSKFGTLLAIHDETFDRRGMSDCAAIIDADFLTKWTQGWNVIKFDLKKAGIADKIAHLIKEECGLILKNPEAHTQFFLDKASSVVA